jgi:hypothetical protein
MPIFLSFPAKVAEKLYIFRSLSKKSKKTYAIIWVLQ